MSAFPENANYGCVDCGSVNHTTGDVMWCRVEQARERDQQYEQERASSVIAAARYHERDTGHRCHGIDADYAACRDCEFVAERHGPLGLVVVTEGGSDDGGWFAAWDGQDVD